MTINEINEDNMMNYSEVIPAELLLEIRREYTRGLTCDDDVTGEVLAAIIWELKNVEDENQPTEAEVGWFFATNEESGELLLNSYELCIENNNVKRTYFEIEKLSDQEEKVLNTCGYHVENAESQSIYVRVEEFLKIKLPKKNPLRNVSPLSEISSRQFKSGIMNCVYHKRYGMLDDLPFLSITRFNPDLSCCVILDGRVGGFLLIHETQDGVLRPELLFSIESDASIHILNMMKFAINTANENVGPDKLIQIKRYNINTMKLAERLFPGKKGDMIYKVEKKH